MILHLRNGDRLSGFVLLEDAGHLTLTNPALGKVVVPISQIERREKTGAGEDGKPAGRAPASMSETAPKPVIRPDSKPPAAPDATAPKTPAEPVPAKGPNRWTAEAQIGTNLRYSAKEQQDYYVTGKATYGWDRLRQIMDYSFAYGKTEGILSANRMTGSSKTEWNTSKKWYVYNLAGAGYDEIRKTELQYEIGPGMGYELINSTNYNVVVKSELGMSFQDQCRADGTRLSTYSARIAETFVWKVRDKLTIDGRVEYFPNVESLEDYRIRAETNLRYPLSKHLSLNLTVIDLYDTLPASGVTPNDLQIRSAVALKF
ncbi:MAG: DUF481 domain-containing protein [Chloroflexi bacterium]|nr:DUF481 domain-containing protein [Chloroflexota bacterium]